MQNIYTRSLNTDTYTHGCRRDYGDWTAKAHSHSRPVTHRYRPRDHDDDVVAALLENT